MRSIRLAAALLAALPLASVCAATELRPGDPAPLFTARVQDGSDFSLASRRGRWTVLFFYPRAGTPGCTRQVCAFRDSLDVIRAAGAEVYGISTDDVAAQAAFHQQHRLGFPLLADPDGAITELYGARRPMANVAQRWTFIIDPTLTIRQVQRDVDPAQDAQRVAAEIARLKQSPPIP